MDSRALRAEAERRLSLYIWPSQPTVRDKAILDALVAAVEAALAASGTQDECKIVPMHTPHWLPTDAGQRKCSGAPLKPTNDTQNQAPDFERRGSCALYGDLLADEQHTGRELVAKCQPAQHADQQLRTRALQEAIARLQGRVDRGPDNRAHRATAKNITILKEMLAALEGRVARSVLREAQDDDARLQDPITGSDYFRDCIGADAYTPVSSLGKYEAVHPAVVHRVLGEAKTRFPEAADVITSFAFFKSLDMSRKVSMQQIRQDNP